MVNVSFSALAPNALPLLYYEKRLGEVEQGTATKGPLKWEGYERLRAWFARGMAFERGDLSGLGRDALTAQIVEDASEALRHYGEKLDIRRNSLQSLLPGGSEVQILRVRLIYEGGGLKPMNVFDLKAALDETLKGVPGVEVSFQ